MTDTAITFRTYVRTGEWANEDTQLVTCGTDYMAKAVEMSAYAGENDTDRFFTLVDGRMVEVDFRCIRSGDHADENDYLHYTYGVFVKDDADNLADEPIDTFYVRIDGRS